MEMKAYVYKGVNDARLEDIPIPKANPGEVVVKVSLTCICRTDLHILEGKLPIKPGTVLGHEVVGVIHEIGDFIHGFEVGDRVVIPADTACGTCLDCMRGPNGMACHADGSIAGFQIGLMRNGTQAEYVSVPYAQANMCKVPDSLTDEQVVMTGDVITTGLAASEAGQVSLGDVVAVFGLGPIGIVAAAGAKLRGASLVIGIEPVSYRAEMAKKMAAVNITLDPRKENIEEALEDLTHGRMPDVTIEAVGKEETFVAALGAIRPGGIFSNVGNHGFVGSYTFPLTAFMGGIGDKKIVSVTAPGGNDRMRRLLLLMEHQKLDFSPLITHTVRLEETEVKRAYDIFCNFKDDAIKVAIRP
jgi:threonine dehydrogenase-like Zn-dependent dehydrogenase